jgi:nucleoside phosphorylase
VILLFYAFAREIAPFKRRCKKRSPVSYHGLHGFTAMVASKQFTVLGHGIGHRRARGTILNALELVPHPEMIIATGVAGALSSGLKPGDLILADRLLQIESDGEIARRVDSIKPADLQNASRALTRAGLHFSTGAMLTMHRVISVAEKRLAKETTGAIAVDMETAAIAAEAGARNIPFISLRAVLDEVDDEVPGAEVLDDQGRVRPLAATSYFVRNPGVILELPKMVRNLSRATKSIADAIEAIAYDGEMPKSRKKRATGLAG